MNKIRLVTFDVTGCLLRLRRPVQEVYAEVAASYGLKLQNTQMQQFGAAFKESYKDLDTRFPCFGARHGVSERDWWRQVVLHSFRRVGVTGRSQCLDRVFNDLYQRYATPDEWAVDEGVSYLLPELWHHGFRLGIITNWDNRIYELLNWLGISDWLHFVVNSQQARTAKPESEIFDVAAKQASKYLCEKEAAEIRNHWLHVGSDWKVDIYGARKAGVAWAVRYSLGDNSRQPDEMTGMKGIFEVKHLAEIHHALFRGQNGHHHSKEPYCSRF